MCLIVKQNWFQRLFDITPKVKVAEKDINVYGLNCPNCGAVVHSLQNKTCSYCKTGLNIQVVNLLKCWKLIECKDN